MQNDNVNMLIRPKIKNTKFYKKTYITEDR